MQLQPILLYICKEVFMMAIYKVMILLSLAFSLSFLSL